MPGATVARLVSDAAPMAVKVFMIPQTVPKRPRNGDTEPVDARKIMRRLR